jgi:hypothetical protein
MTEVRQFHEVERGVEEALRNFAGRGANSDGEVPEITAAERIQKIGSMSALAIIEASETTAKDIEEAAQAAVDIAADIMEEAQQLATELRANGKKMSEHLQEFAVLARKVSTAMRDTRADVLNPPETLLKTEMAGEVSAASSGWRRNSPLNDDEHLLDEIEPAGGNNIASAP